MTPAFTSSSLNFPISARSFSLGITLASEFFVAFTITITRIGPSPFSASRPVQKGTGVALQALSPLSMIEGPGRAVIASIYTSNETSPDRHAATPSVEPRVT
jgi:hypothetical protein